MLYIYLTLASGMLSGLISLFFRRQELQKEVILMHKQLITQIAFFVSVALIFKEFFSHIVIDLWFLKLGWFLIYIAFSSVSYYAVQVFYEYYSWNKLFADEEEMQKYIEKIEKDTF